MATTPLREAVDGLLTEARQAPLAVMCAERQPGECHRWYLAAALVVAGARVVHLIALGRREPHRLNPLVRLENGVLIYDRGTTGDLALS